MEASSLFNFEPFSSVQEPGEDPTPALNCQGPTDEIGHAFFARWLVPPQVNVYLPDQIWVWGRLVEDGLDLDIEACDVASIGNMTPAFEYTLEDGLDGLLSAEMTYRDQRYTYWAIEHGIAPGQPFLVWIGQPKFSRDYWGECDVDIPFEIVHVLPRARSRIARRWDRAVRHMREDRDAVEAHKKLTRELELSTVEAMFIYRTHYWSSSWHDEMTPPNGVRLTIMSDHSKIPTLNSNNAYGGQIASGEDDDGNENRALMRLITRATQINPALDEARVRALPYRSGW